MTKCQHFPEFSVSYWLKFILSKLRQEDVSFRTKFFFTMEEEMVSENDRSVPRRQLHLRYRDKFIDKYIESK